MTTLYEYSEAVAKGAMAPPPIAQLLGFEIEEVAPGRAVVGFSADERFANPMGTLHGGVLCDIADAAMGIAYGSTLAEGESFTTVELKMNFLRPVWNARLRAVASVKQGGRTIGLIECDVLDEQDRLVAHASSTCMTLREDGAGMRRTNGA
jgi:uncharacterized protein (TIGR00369 family)